MIDQGHTTGRPMPGFLPWQSYFLAFGIGIFSFKYPTPALLALGLLVLADTTIRGWLHRLPVLVFLFCAAFGYGYASQRMPDVAETPAWMEARQAVQVQGVVDRAEPRQNGRLRIVLRDVIYTLDGEQAALPGMIVWTWRKPDYDPVPGQSVSVPLRIVPVRNFGNPGGWDYSWYWQRQGVLWRAWPAGRGAVIEWGDRPESFLWGMKSALRKAVAEHLPKTQGGAMVLALGTGDRSLIDQATTEATRAAGLAHTLALSGLHVGFVAAMGLGLAWLVGWIYPPLLLRVPRPKLAVCLAAPLVLGYAWLGQPSQSLIRAATMFGFWGILLLQGRGRVLMDGLFFALAVILFLSPLAIFDLSLQMSALAVAGIGLMYPTIRTLLYGGHSWWTRLLCWAGGLLGISLCANIALLPLVSWNFGTWSPNILLNLIWLPVLGFAVMPLGIAGMLLSTMSWTAPLGGALLVAASEVMGWLITLLHFTGDCGLTPVFSVLRPLWMQILGVGLLLLAALMAMVNRRVLVGMAGLGFALMVWPHVGVMLQDSQDEVRLSLIDVGLGQSAVISTPGGHRWLIDGGAGSKTFDLGESVVAPYLTYGRPPRLDGVFLSHPDADHSHGIPFILSRFDVGAFYTNGSKPRGRTGKRMVAALETSGMQETVVHAGMVVHVGKDTVIEVLHPDTEFKKTHANERSLVLRLVRNGKSLALIPGDIERDGVSRLLSSGQDIRAEVLVLPHHGSRSSLVPALYQAVAPEVALCSNGYLNKYGFPHEEVVRGVGVPVLTTSRYGMITGVWGLDNTLSVKGFRP